MTTISKKVILDNREIELIFQDTTLITEILKLNNIEYDIKQDLSQCVNIFIKNTLKKCCISLYFEDETDTPCVAINICKTAIHKIDVDDFFNYYEENVDFFSIHIKYDNETKRLADFQNVLNTTIFLSNRI